MERILVYGLGGHSKVIQMMIARSTEQEVNLIVDDDKEKCDELGPIKIVQAKKIKQYGSDFDSMVIAIGTNAIRKKVVQNYQQKNFAIIIDPTVIMAEDSLVGEGTVVMPMVVINPAVQIGKHCIINTGAIIEHDCQVGDYSHISPGAILTGAVKLGEMVHVGANATILPGMTIGDNAVIGAGAVVTKNVIANSVMVGNPARQIR